MSGVPKTDRLWPWVRYYLEHHLPVHRGGRANTQATYRAAFRRLREYLYFRFGRRAASDLTLEAVDPQLVLDFLGWLQTPEGGRNGASTRNARLATLRSFFRCLELYCPAGERPRWQRLRLLPDKRTPKPVAQHLEVHEMDQVFAQTDPSRPIGLRDLALLAVLYNTGARASEVAGLQRHDLTFGESPMARFRCKGGREHRCPLWPATVLLLRRYLDETGTTTGPVFLNQRGGRLTRSGIARRVAHYVGHAGDAMPSLRTKRLSTHSFRHSTAIHLLESGADMHVIKAWLGHRSTRSTDHYLDLNLQNQRELLSRFAPPSQLKGLMEQSEDNENWLDSL